ncbi:trypsin-like peptidase domain-containing protein [Bacillus spongiae]|uniref:Trypsin-like peptidase domain-containing protein n=1 Tax=Bacillus spongiae TaxID=2683610 RepID=A0ABU8HGS4_9BACI
MSDVGYYDGDEFSRENTKKSHKGGYFIASLVGLILGAFIVVVALPRLVDTNVFSYGDKTEEKETVSETKNYTTGVSVDVTSGVTEAVEKAGDSVVGISNIQAGGGFWSTDSQEAGTGSGVIYKKDGDVAYIATNYHVIEGADQLEVTLADGTKVPATVRGGDQWTDLAVLEIEAKSIKDEAVAEFGDSSALKAGEPVIAIGNPLGLQFSGSVTQGIVSGVERTIPVDIDQNGTIDWHAEVLQTDAAINPGNSGGALINISGQLVGINSMKIAQSAVEGIGLAIPINYAQPIIEDLEKHGEIRRPSMGVRLQNVNEVSAYHQSETLKLPEDVKDGVLIENVVPNSPAALAGLKELDVIVELDGEKITDIIELRQYLYNEKNVGDSMEVKFYRDGKLQTITMNLADASTI